MEEKKEVVIKGASEQRSQIKSATGQDPTELKIGPTENANSRSANYSDDRSFLGAVLDDRSFW